MEEIKSYGLLELAELEGKSHPTIKNSWRYIPIRIYSPTIEKRAKLGKQSKPYLIKYIRLEDVQKALKGKVDFNYLTTR